MKIIKCYIHCTVHIKKVIVMGKGNSLETSALMRTFFFFFQPYPLIFKCSSWMRLTESCHCTHSIATSSALNGSVSVGPLGSSILSPPSPWLCFSLFLSWMACIISSSFTPDWPSKRQQESEAYTSCDFLKEVFS